MRNFGLPMTLQNMRDNGARSVTAKCEACGHEATVNVDALPESVHVPDAGYLRCSRCGGNAELRHKTSDWQQVISV
jgi:hypothetical protein